MENDCKHIHLVKTTMNHGTFDKEIYRCEKCKQLLKGVLEILSIAVIYPNKEKEAGI